MGFNSNFEKFKCKKSDFSTNLENRVKTHFTKTIKRRQKMSKKPF